MINAFSHKKTTEIKIELNLTNEFFIKKKAFIFLLRIIFLQERANTKATFYKKKKKKSY